MGRAARLRRRAVQPVAPAPLPASRGLPPRARLPLLALGFIALAAGSAAGLVRSGWSLGTPAAGLVALHGPLMVCGFFGLLIALERAVAVGRAWVYLGPVLAAAAVVCLLSANVVAAAWLFVASSVVLLAATADVMRRQPALFTLTLTLGAAGLVAGSVLWALGAAVADALPWWLAFLVLTIAGERLELSRFLPPSRAAHATFAVLLALVAFGLAARHLTSWGAAPFGAALLGLAAWLFKQDIARRTVHGRGLTRFIAVCLLAGYVWLAVGAALFLADGTAPPGSPVYDAALHAITLGFVFSMVFGHAPIILPAVTKFSLPYRSAFYAPLALLQLSLVVRLGGDAAGSAAWMRAGALLNAIALAAFIAVTAFSIARGRRSPRVHAAGAS
ncbi:MAG: hypothetical protein ABIZ18_11545 [Caldimonas sp.]